MSPKLKRPSVRFVVVTSALLLVAAGITALFVPPPRPVLRWLVVSSAPILLDDYAAAPDGRLVGAAKKVIRLYTNVAVAAHVADRAIDERASDEEILKRLLIEARMLVLTPRPPGQIRYPTASWPALFSGLGYCDQVNALVCRMAAHHFPKAELVALYDPATHTSPHTIGRVWSEERGEWIYFDATYAEAVLFTRDEAGERRSLPSPEIALMRERPDAPKGIYDLTGWTMSAFSSTFGMYVVDRLVDRLSKDVGGADEDVAVAESTPATTAEQSPRASTAGRTRSAGKSARAGIGHLKRAPSLTSSPTWAAPRRQPRRDPAVFDRIVREFAAARIAHIFDGPDARAYSRIAKMAPAATRDDRADELANAAARFASLGSTTK